MRREHRRHGMGQHKLYRTWYNMMLRCYEPKHHGYSDYGGRGIWVCRRWHKVENFIKDMENGYHPGLTLERIDNGRDYGANR